MFISERTAKNLGTENAFVVLGEVAERIRKGQDIISFCIGQPDFDTPENIKQAAYNALKEGKTGYTSSDGIFELRKAISEYMNETRDLSVNPRDVVVACGGKPIIGWSVLSTTDYGKGHEVIYPNPGYPIYESQTIVNGAVPKPIPLIEEKKFVFDLDVLEESITKNTKLIIINSPQNPTGSILTRPDLKKIADLAIEHDLWVLSDEVYSRILHEGTFTSIASLQDMQERTIILDSLSKTYAMTGWRIGFGINRTLAPYFTRWNTNTDACAPHPFQWAAIEALQGSQKEPDKMSRSFTERRDLIVKLLNDIDGVKCHSPGGAFYVFPNVTKACKKVGVKSSEEFRKKLLDKNGVAVLSDTHFGKKNPGQTQEYIRLSYATSPENIKEGVARLKEFIEHGKGK